MCSSDLIPVIYPKLEGIDEVFEDCVLYYNPLDAEDLANKIKKILKDDNLKKDLILKGRNKLNKIRCAFIDEAQDLNYIQYRIVILLKEKLNVVLNFIGDPNQNIFQFRDSEAKYFIEFNGLEFVLTYNFRSHSEIIDFSKDLRSDKTHPIVSTKGNLGIKPVIFEGNIEEMLIKLLYEILEFPRVITSFSNSL